MPMLHGVCIIPDRRYSPRAAVGGMNRCDSGTDRIVWMEEEFFSCLFCPEKLFSPGIFAVREVFMEKRKLSTRAIAVNAMFTALAFIAVLISKVIPNVAGFLSYEPKDAIIVIAGFIFGPMSCVLISLLGALIEMLTISQTGIYGFLMNAVASCAFTVPAAVVYKRVHSQKGAMLGLALGVLTMAGTMLLWNYVITPYYMGVDRAVVAGMLAKVFLPFNLVKGGLNAALTLLLYKPVVTALRRAGLVEESRATSARRISLGFTLFALAVLTSFVLLFLALIGVL